MKLLSKKLFVIHKSGEFKQTAMRCFAPLSETVELKYFEYTAAEGSKLLMDPDEVPTLLLAEVQPGDHVIIDNLIEFKSHSAFHFVPIVVVAPTISNDVRHHLYASKINCVITLPEESDEVAKTLSAVVSLWLQQSR